MANRNKNFNETLSSEMEDFEFAQGFLLNLIHEHGLNIQDALISAIEASGLSKFAERNDFSIQAVSDFVHRRRDYKIAVVDKYLRAFGLKVKLGVEKVA